MPQEIVFTLRPTDARTFSGAAFTCLMAAAEQAVPVKLYYVRFEAGARTNWHSHSGDQVLVVCAGRCRYQSAGEPVREIEAGESVRFTAGVRHWHGATTSEGAEHIAINLDCRETNWLERVSEEDYDGTIPPAE
jgi:quercetin dioxygenase-like cupin family protein